MPGSATAELSPHQNQVQPHATCSGPGSLLWHHPLSLSHVCRNFSYLKFPDLPYLSSQLSSADTVPQVHPSLADDYLIPLHLGLCFLESHPHLPGT